MKKFLKLKNIFICGCLALFAVFTYLLSTDEYSRANFRTMQDIIPFPKEIDLTGLREIQASGGPSINFSDLKKKLAHIKKQIIIVDAMRQYH